MIKLYIGTLKFFFVQFVRSYGNLLRSQKISHDDHNSQKISHDDEISQKISHDYEISHKISNDD